MNVTFGYQHFAQNAEPEIPDSAVVADGIPALLWRELVAGNQIADNLAQIDIDTLVYFKAEVQLYPEKIICAKAVNGLLPGVGLIGHTDADKPVGSGPFCLFVKNRI